VLETGRNAPVVFNAANEIAVDAFLKERIGFLQISSVVSATLDVCDTGNVNTLEEVLEFDRMAREAANEIVHSYEGG